METENPNSRLERFQTRARRLFDARPSWLFRGDSSGEPADSLALIAESFRTLCANLRIYTAGQYHTLMVTSPAPGEGKSLTVANLAVSLTRRRLSVLLVDADLRRPVLHRIFQLSNDVGLSDVLKGEAEHDNVIRQTQEGLNVLTSGTEPDDPTVLLESGRMREIITDCTRKYQIILFDTPPVLSTPDAVLLTPLVDWTVLVLGAETTLTEEAKRAKVMLETANGKVLGSILNSMNSQLAPGYHKYSNYYTHSSGDE